ncbi:hypothetical protein VM1G_04803 [Cytospora mali]|uniref:Uncharacterized protein n=1 Tax=Cytospora mali TaxID=578113 RepID=A0A194W0J8_CYTMA|nr:hypothetical protein VM1G_04803 [Valsa mali]
MGDDSFYEELNADFSGSLGSLKTNNPEGDRFQRPFIHLSPEKSKFRKTVEPVLCVHGWKEGGSGKPMTLLIIGVHLTCHDKDFRFQTVKIRLAFHEDDKADPPNAEKAEPRVVAYAPWVQQKIWGETDENIEETTEYSGAAGVDKVVQLDLDAKKGRKRTFTRKHFDRGTADRLIDQKTFRIYGVEWFCQQNSLQTYGVQPYFHLAVLLERSHTKTGDGITFRAVYDMRVEAGFKHDVQQGLRRVFRLFRPEDAPVYFDPSIDHEGSGLEGYGTDILKKIDKDNLGILAEKGKLSSLLELDTKTLQGLDPMQPPVL